MHKLDGRVAIVTGGARGIGASIARTLAAYGADIAILDWMLDEEAAALVSEIELQGRRVQTIEVDVSVSEQVNAAVQEVLKSYGRIDILVNNAGICPFRDLLSISDEIWQKTLNVNLSGMFYLARAVAPTMMEQQSGVIINISTVSTQICSPHQVHYIASKGGVDALTRALAVALSPYNVRVNAVAPLGAATAINANAEEQRQAWEKSGMPRIQRHSLVRRPGETQDYANGVLYLVSDEASFITGIVLPIEGGALIF
ncbi:SDR family NAD(P)-dependent oxidoreductase [Dictyobacter aurantiacus]|uniref:Beta-ketoacyl-ACP reductase n=1 Tax=Dictyobacter aurantiacus TaxID=1936993 RepID=A0A401ZLE1_9CHLR|nr:glucose 1-dehydrogenase [Dictyobacter aurantiacus]GCE07634.1 beta-ketoacyl-ACP reductase [Dictyobacter aurantiacus]